MNKHTPGPWNAVGYLSDAEIVGGNGSRVVTKVVVSIGMTREEVIANRNLISAAPELLEALEEVLPKFTSDGVEFSDKELSTISKARAAIAKARCQG